MRTFRFNKEQNGEWYVDLPEWVGDKAALEMVAGADTLLDVLAQGESQVDVTMSIEGGFEGYTTVLTLLERDDTFDGAWYEISSAHDMHGTFECWLCPVIVFVFGYYPEKIFLR